MYKSIFLQLVDSISAIDCSVDVKTTNTGKYCITINKLSAVNGPMIGTPTGFGNTLDEATEDLIKGMQKRNIFKVSDKERKSIIFIF